MDHKPSLLWSLSLSLPHSIQTRIKQDEETLMLSDDTAHDLQP